jgi:hypothetical protein
MPLMSVAERVKVTLVVRVTVLPPLIASEHRGAVLSAPIVIAVLEAAQLLPSLSSI